jgi:methylmalonyl-CoA mutase C-terminal domain/subunit
MPEEKAIRVLIAKPGLDGHDRGAKVIALGLRDAGFEVIYTGIRQTPQMIARAALQEDVHVVGLSCLSGAHRILFPKVVNLLRQSGREDVLVIGGGVIPEEDVPFLKERGVQAIFTSGALISHIADYIRENLPAGRQA